jgi:hypothetical protein
MESFRRSQAVNGNGAQQLSRTYSLVGELAQPPLQGGGTGSNPVGVR